MTKNGTDGFVSRDGQRLLRNVIVLVTPAAVLAVVIVVVSLLAADALRQRDAAVQDGILYRLAHEFEGRLREQGPDEAPALVRSFLEDNRGTLAGVELQGPSGTITLAGNRGERALELPLSLGPLWRVGPGVPGAGMGGGWGRGRMHPYSLRLHPAAGLGSAGRLPVLIVSGALLAAVALVAFSVFAAVSLLHRQQIALVEAERRRLEAVALAGAGLAHRIRNPLATIKGTAQVLHGKLDPAGQERAQRIVESSQRIERLLDRLLEFARPPVAHPEKIDLPALIESLADRMGPSVRVASTKVASARADREHVESMLEELLTNARAFDPSGDIEVDAHTDGGRVIVEVRDRGPGLGIDGDRAFDPYVTTRPDGTGLGLSIVRALATANAGDVVLLPREGGGCVARLSLPAAEG